MPTNTHTTKEALMAHIALFQRREQICRSTANLLCVELQEEMNDCIFLTEETYVSASFSRTIDLQERFNATMKEWRDEATRLQEARTQLKELSK